MSKLEDLIESLELRHFGDERKFLQVYGQEIWDKFAGAIPVFKAFVDSLPEETEELSSIAVCEKDLEQYGIVCPFTLNNPDCNVNTTCRGSDCIAWWHEDDENGHCRLIPR